MLDEEGIVLAANERARDLLGTRELEGGSFFARVEDGVRLKEQVRAALRERGAHEATVRLRAEEGGQGGQLLVSFLPFVLSGRGYVVASLGDASGIREVECALREARHLVFLGRMLADISHHVRNPILVIGGLARRLKRKPERVSSYSSAIIYQCERLEALLAALERFVLLRAPRWRSGSLEDLLRGLERRFEPEVRGAPPELVVLSGEQGLRVLTDPDLLLEALEEVVRNALEAHQAAGVARPVEVRALREGSALVFWVEDFGEGIDLEALPYIFNPFFSTKPGHLGMGLTLASRIMDELHGSIEVSHLAQPTRIKLSLPLEGGLCR